MFYRKSNNPQTWRDHLGEIQTIRKEIKDNAGIMTQYERVAADRILNERIQALWPMVAGGALEEHEAAIQKYQQSVLNSKKAASKEVDRWDAGKLNAEMTLTQKRLELAIKAGDDPLKGDYAKDRIQAIYNEAQSSGDIHKKRGALEVFKSLTTMIPGREGRLEVGILEAHAERELKNLSITPEQESALAAEGEAWQQLQTARNAIRDVGITMNGRDPEGLFEGGALTNALKRVQVDSHTGQVHIYAPDAPEVSGIHLVDKTQSNVFGEV